MSKAWCERHGRGFLLSEGCIYCEPRSAKPIETRKFILPRAALLGTAVRICNTDDSPLHIEVDGGDLLLVIGERLPLLRTKGSMAEALYTCRPDCGRVLFEQDLVEAP